MVLLCLVPPQRPSELFKKKKKKTKENVCYPKSQSQLANINQPGAHKSLYMHFYQIESSVHRFQKALAKPKTQV